MQSQVLALVLFILAVIIVLAIASLSKPKKLKPIPPALKKANEYFEKGDWNSTVINAFSAVEFCLKHQKLDGSAVDKINAAVRKGYISQTEASALHKARMERNRILHDGSSIQKSHASQHLRACRNAIRKMGYSVE